MNRLEDIHYIEVCQLWINVIQSTVLAAVLVYVGANTKPSDVLRRLEAIEVKYSQQHAQAMSAIESSQLWSEDISKELKLIKAKHPHIKAK